MNTPANALDGLTVMATNRPTANWYALYTCPRHAMQRRVFILGTSAKAELALRFLRDQSIECAGFIDTNGGADLRRYVFGRPVLGRLDDLGWLSERHGISEVILPDCEQILLPGIDFQAFCQLRALRLTKLGLYEDRKDELRGTRAAKS